MSDTPPEPSTSEEILRLRAALAALEAETARLRGAFMTASFEGLTISVGGTIIEANDAVAALARCPREQLIGKTVFDFTTKESAALVHERIRAGDESPYEITAVRTDGTEFPCEILGRNITYQGRPARVTAFRDLSERKRAEGERRRLEEQVLRAQRLEQLGALTGGIAHDFNNLLLVVLAHSELGLAAEGSPLVHEHFEQIRSAALRAGELTKQMLNYAGKSPRTIEALDLGELVRTTVAELEGSLANTARVVLEPPTGPCSVEADGGQLRQVVVNLVTNAAEALGTSGGEIRVRTGGARVSSEDLSAARLDASSGPGAYACIEVLDTGAGMNQETLDRIFDPFFSTKFSGRGLGLASVLGIVRTHRGAIKVTSEPGAGSRFTVFLPTSGGTTSPAESMRRAESTLLRGVALVADDEPMVRRLAKQLLEGLGLEVLVAADGYAAIELFRKKPSGVDIVVLDMTMPRIGGAETARILRALRADLPILMMSGYHDSEPVPEGGAPTSFLAKPFDSRALAEKVRALLGQS